LQAIIETASELACRPCHKPVCRFGHHRCMREIAPEQVIAATRRAISAGG
jgi:heptosyltransferase II